MWGVVPLSVDSAQRFLRGAPALIRMTPTPEIQHPKQPCIPKAQHDASLLPPKKMKYFFLLWRRRYQWRECSKKGRGSLVLSPEILNPLDVYSYISLLYIICLRPCIYIYICIYTSRTYPASNLYITAPALNCLSSRLVLLHLLLFFHASTCHNEGLGQGLRLRFLGLGVAVKWLCGSDGQAARSMHAHIVQCRMQLWPDCGSHFLHHPPHALRDGQTTQTYSV